LVSPCATVTSVNVAISPQRVRTGTDSFINFLLGLRCTSCWQRRRRSGIAGEQGTAVHLPGFEARLEECQHVEKTQSHHTVSAVQESKPCIPVSPAASVSAFECEEDSPVSEAWQ